MKIFAFFAVFAEKARPDINDEMNSCMKQVNELKSFTDECMQYSFFNQPGKQRIEKKLGTFDRGAYTYCTFAEYAQATINAETGGERINREDPCSCISGIAGAYESFFNRVQADYPEIRGYKRNQVVRVSKNLVKNVLNKKFGCSLPYLFVTITNTI